MLEREDGCDTSIFTECLLASELIFSELYALKFSTIGLIDPTLTTGNLL
jgi:hypothetical protein